MATGSIPNEISEAEGSQTPDHESEILALSQLSYGPTGGNDPSRIAPIARRRGSVNQFSRDPRSGQPCPGHVDPRRQDEGRALGPRRAARNGLRGEDEERPPVDATERARDDVTVGGHAIRDRAALADPDRLVREGRCHPDGALGIE